MKTTMAMTRTDEMSFLWWCWICFIKIPTNCMLRCIVIVNNNVLSLPSMSQFNVTKHLFIHRIPAFGSIDEYIPLTFETIASVPNFLLVEWIYLYWIVYRMEYFHWKLYAKHEWKYQYLILYHIQWKWHGSDPSLITVENDESSDCIKCHLQSSSNSSRFIA